MLSTGEKTNPGPLGMATNSVLVRRSDTASQREFLLRILMFCPLSCSVGEGSRMASLSIRDPNSRLTLRTRQNLRRFEN